LCASVSVGLGLLAASSAGAATVKVTTTADEFGTGPPCALREAVQAANTDHSFGGCTRKGPAGKDTVVLKGGRTYTRSLGGADDANASGDLDVEGKLAIEVTGKGRATVDAGHLDRIIEVRPGASLDASHLILTKGMVTEPQDQAGGGGILNYGRLALRATYITHSAAPATSGTGCFCAGAILAELPAELTDLRNVSLTHNATSENGGAIATFDAKLTISRSTIAANSAATGGGIFSDARVVIRGSTISGNEALGNFYSNGGGGLFVSGHSVDIVNSTISGNRAFNSGGGLLVYDGHVTMNGVTVTANTADVGADADGHGGGIADPVEFQNSIVSGNFDLNPTNPAPDCIATSDVPAHNLVGLVGGCTLGGSNVGDDGPPLKPLADNGGPTKTHALAKHSAAIGRAGKNAPNRDQRGVKRDAEPDIGAYER